MRHASLTLTPLRIDSTWSAFEFDLRFELDSIPAGEALFTVPHVVVSIPGPAYSSDAFTVSDARGALTVRELPVSEGLGGTWRGWAADRATEGALRVQGVAPTRHVDEQTPVGPLFDLRSEELGLFGAGIGFLPLPPTDAMPSFTDTNSGEQHAIELWWVLGEGVEGISSRGVGDQQWEGSLQSLRFAYFAAGTPVSVPGGDSPFGLHAFAEPPFALDEIADYLHELLAYSSAFFEDDVTGYRVLIRKNPSAGTGGTALPGSFAFGFSATQESDPDALRSLLAHEMTHNWPHLDDDPATTSWYSEGAAEYYSHVLPLRAGLLSRERFAEQLNERHLGYDTNPLRVLSNAEANARAWIDPRSQRIPYGRGLAYLIWVDARIRAATDGANSLDDVTVSIVREQRAGGKVSNSGWVERVAEFLGDEARASFDAMGQGDPIDLAGITFEGFRAVETTAAEFDLGFDMASYRSEGRLVQGVNSNGPASAAGMRDGDALVALQLPYHQLRSSDRPLTIDVVRDGTPMTIEYVPAGDTVSTIRWETVV